MGFLLNMLQACHYVCGIRQVSAQRDTSMSSRLQEDRFLLNISEHDTSMSLCVAQHNPVNADCDLSASQLLELITTTNTPSSY